MELPVLIEYYSCKDCRFSWRTFPETWEYFSRCNKCNKTLKPSESKLINDNRTDIKCFGYFKCKKCKFFWKSPHTWILYPQKCEKCHTFSNPYSLLENGIFSHIKGKHDRASCGKCLELGDCTLIQSIDVETPYKDSIKNTYLTEKVTTLSTQPESEEITHENFYFNDVNIFLVDGEVNDSVNYDNNFFDMDEYFHY